MSQPPTALPERLEYFRSTYPPTTTTVDGLEVRYVDTSTGTDPVLFLPGGTGEAEASFDYILRLAGKHRVIAISYPTVSSMDTLTDAIAGVLERLDVPRVNLWGTSFGGMVAQRFGLRHPTKVNSMTLSNTSAPDPARATQVKKQAKLSRLLPSAVSRSMLRKAFGRLLAGTSEEDRAFWEAYLNETFVPNYEAKLRILNQLSLDFYGNADLFEEIDHAWQERMLVIDAKDDDLYSSMHDRLVALYPSAELVTFEEGGHATTVSQAPRYIEAVTGFVSRLGS